jgi:TonB family C-terminal domain
VSERDYPRLARDRRWQGTTQLVLRIRADGSLGEVIVATSSGYEILDERALEVVNQIKLPAVPLEIQSRAFAVRIPVRFDLKE